MTKVYIMDLGCYQFRGYTWDKEVNEILSLNPDKIFCIGLEEPHPLNWFTEPLFRKLLPWLIEHDKYVNVIGGIKHFLNKDLPLTDLLERIVYETSPMGCLFWGPSKQFDLCRHIMKPYQAPKLFTCYNHNTKIERALLVDELAKHNLINDGIVTLHNPDKFVNADHSPYVWKYHDGSTLLDPLELDFNSTFPGLQFPKSFTQGFFDVVTETVYGPEEYFITEKTTKSLGMARPFITLACKGYHAFLRDTIGIQLYDEMFDYSFDSCDKIEDRIDGIVENIRRLKDLLATNEQKLKMFNLIKTKLYHNVEQRDAILWDIDVAIPKGLHALVDDSSCVIYGDRAKQISVIQHTEVILTSKTGLTFNWGNQE